MSGSPSWLETTLARIPGARVTVLGDFCVDAYWPLDTADPPEISIETGLAVHRVRQQRYGLGGAGNVVANLVDLGVRQVRALGVIGEDPFGHCMRRLLRDRGVDDSGLLHGAPGWQTPVYAKPLMGDAELNRIDFGAFNELDEQTAARVEQALEAAAAESDIVVLNQQLPQGLSTPAMIARINGVIDRGDGQTHFIADSRHRPELYRGAMLKLNMQEAARMCSAPQPVDVDDDNLARRLAVDLYDARERPGIYLTRSQRGMIAFDEDDLFMLPAVRVDGEVDPVGAGDTVLAALAAVLGSDGSTEEAANLAMFAAAVTVKKLKTTGTATPGEVRAVAARSER